MWSYILFCILFFNCESKIFTLYLNLLIRMTLKGRKMWIISNGKLNNYRTKAYWNRNGGTKDQTPSIPQYVDASLFPYRSYAVFVQQEEIRFIFILYSLHKLFHIYYIYFVKCELHTIVISLCMYIFILRKYMYKH